MVVLLFAFTTLGASADPEPAIADNGREVLIHPDGSWEYISEDRFATTADGTRIRLKPDGSWAPVNQAEAERYGFSQKGGFSRDVAAAGPVDLRLDEVVIETHRSKRGKNAIESSQMVFTLTVKAERGLHVPRFSPADFTVTDSRGRQYETIGVSPPSLTIAPLGEAPIEVTVADSPGFGWGLKFFRLTIAPAAFGTDDEVELTKVKGEVLERDVDSLE